MKLTIPQPALTDALAWALNAVSARPPAPALSGVRIEAAEGVARFTGFDYETMAATTATVDTDTPGVVVAPGRATLDVVKGLPKKSTVTLEVTDAGKLRITAARSKYEIPLIPSDQYPQVPDLPGEVGTVDGGLFGDAVKRAHAVSAKDAAQPALLGLHITGDTDHLLIEASDRYRIHEEKVPAKLDGSVDWLIRADRLGGKIPANGEVRLLSDGTLFGLRTGNRALVTTVMGDEFPKFARLWPTDADTTVAVDREQLVTALQAVSTVLDKNRPLDLAITETEITVSGGSTDGGEGVEFVPCRASDPITVSYNPVYLRDAVNGVGGDEVGLAFTVPARPVVVTGIDGRRALAMPQLRK